jgi:WhiB family transcriptional regulator, redox-sensing transcriptional regulator
MTHDVFRPAELAPAGLAAGENWRAAAACRSADPDLFFPVSDVGKGVDQAAEAKAICAGCRVRLQCLAFAERTRQGHGIWGGLTERERYVPPARWN